MPIPLGILAAAGFRQAAGSYDLLETVILSSSQASVTFSNLNSTYGSTYQHLQIRAVTRQTAAGVSVAMGMLLNGSSSNFAYHLLFGNGSSVSSAYVANAGIVERSVGNSGPANAFGASVIDILDPFETTKNKTIRVLAGTTENVLINSLGWFNTAAISSIALTSTANFVSGSRFSLYGIKGA